MWANYVIIKKPYENNRQIGENSPKSGHPVFHHPTATNLKKHSWNGSRQNGSEINQKFLRRHATNRKNNFIHSFFLFLFPSFIKFPKMGNNYFWGRTRATRCVIVLFGHFF
jgi:hypothetical protein